MASLQDHLEPERGRGALGAPLLTAAQDEADVHVDLLGSPAHGRPELGGWKCSACIIGAQTLACMASFGISFNLFMYLTEVCHQTSSAAATIVTTVLGTILLCSFVGAFLSDAYLGHLRVVLSFQILSTLCYALINVAVIMISQGGATAAARSFLFVLLYCKGITAGPVIPSSTALGADQLSSVKQKEIFFRLLATGTTLGQLFAVTVVTYIDDMGLWVWGFVVCTAASMANLALLVGAAKYFRQYKAAGNPFLRNFQVLVVACRKCSLSVPEDSSLLYESQGTLSGIAGCRKLQHTTSLSFLDKAAVRGSPDTFDSWHLCTITQVEELKSVLRVIPVGIAMMLVATAGAQTSTLFEVQGSKMNRQLATWLVIPAASMNVFYFASAFLTGVVITVSGARLPGWWFGCGRQGHAKTLTSLQLQGISLMFGIMAMVIAALVESYRLRVAHKGAFLSVMWLVPQTVLVGAALNLATIGGSDFFYNEVSYGMRSVGSSFLFMFQGAGNYLSSIIVTLVTAITTQGGRVGWIPSNPNEGHLDYFYWLLASCLAFTLGVYCIYTHSYEYITATTNVDDHS